MTAISPMSFCDSVYRQTTLRGRQMINQLVLIKAGLVGGVLDLVLSLLTLAVRNYTNDIISLKTVTNNNFSE